MSRRLDGAGTPEEPRPRPGLWAGSPQSGREHPSPHLRVLEPEGNRYNADGCKRACRAFPRLSLDRGRGPPTGRSQPSSPPPRTALRLHHAWGQKVGPPQSPTAKGHPSVHRAPLRSVGPQRNSPGTPKRDIPSQGGAAHQGQGWRFCGMLGVGGVCAATPRPPWSCAAAGEGSLSPQKALRAEGRAAQVRRPRKGRAARSLSGARRRLWAPPAPGMREGQGGWRWRAARP